MMLLLLLLLMMMMMMMMLEHIIIIVITDSSDVTHFLCWLELRKTGRRAERNETGTGSINGLSA